MKVTVPGNKKTPAKTFESGILYKTITQPKSWHDDPAIAFFLLDSIDEENNRMVVYDVLRKKKMRVSTKQQSFFTKNSKQVDSYDMHEMIIVIFETDRWWARYDLSREDVHGVS